MQRQCGTQKWPEKVGWPGAGTKAAIVPSHFVSTWCKLQRSFWSHRSPETKAATNSAVPKFREEFSSWLPPQTGQCHEKSSITATNLHSERRGGIATAPPLRRSYSDRAVTSPGGAFQTDTNLANHRHRTRLLADCQWRCRWRCGLGRLRNTWSLTKTIPRDRRKLIKLMLRKWTFLPPRSHLIRQFVKRHLVTLRREQHVLAQWLRQYFCQDHGVRSVLQTELASLTD